MLHQSSDHGIRVHVFQFFFLLLVAVHIEIVKPRLPELRQIPEELRKPQPKLPFRSLAPLPPHSAGDALLQKGQLWLRFQKFLGDLPQFWQPRFYDFNVYSHEKKKEKLEYMHANPVVRGLVKHPQDWPWSSFSFYAKDEVGLLEIDFVNL